MDHCTYGLLQTCARIETNAPTLANANFDACTRDTDRRERPHAIAERDRIRVGNLADGSIGELTR